jgi:hypothetical protein
MDACLASFAPGRIALPGAGRNRRCIVAPALLALGVAAAGACTTPAPPPQRDRDPTLAALDRIIARGDRGADRGRCLQELARRRLCEPRADATTREIEVRVSLDPRYRRWPRWRARLDATFRCANALYAKTGVRWRIRDVRAWDPRAERHALYALLARLRREVPGDYRSLRLGITVWEPRQIFRLAGGEIGLSQAGACVVPSWPRVENDCVILAHELGHLIGAKHVPGKRWVMGWAARPFHLPARDPLARVIATYRFHPRNVAAIRAHVGARVTPRGLRPTLACRERLRILDRCYGL